MGLEEVPGLVNAREYCVGGFANACRPKNGSGCTGLVAVARVWKVGDPLWYCNGSDALWEGLCKEIRSSNVDCVSEVSLMRFWWPLD